MSDTNKQPVRISEIAGLVSAVWFRKHEGALRDNPYYEEAVGELVNELRGILDSLPRSARIFIIEQIFWLDDVPPSTTFAIQCLCFEYAADSMLLEFQTDFECRGDCFDQRDATLIKHTTELEVLEAYLRDAYTSDEDRVHWALLERLETLLSGDGRSMGMTESLNDRAQEYFDKALPGWCAIDFADQFFRPFHTQENLGRLADEAATTKESERIVNALGYALEDLLELPSTRPAPRSVGL